MKRMGSDKKYLDGMKKRGGEIKSDCDKGGMSFDLFSPMNKLSSPFHEYLS
jgi:hypothetical protein